MAKPEVVIVGEATDKVLYINFFLKGESIPNTLFRLQHPGMLAVERWGNEVIEHTGDRMKLDSTIRTEKFFKECVFPVSESLTPLETSLVEKYGLNSEKKPSPKDIHPRFQSLWHRVATRFLDGDLWNDIPESGDNSEGDYGVDSLVSESKRNTEQEFNDTTPKNKAKSR